MKFKIYDRKAHKFKIIDTDKVIDVDLYNSDPEHGMGPVAIFSMKTKNNTIRGSTIYARWEDGVKFKDYKKKMRNKKKIQDKKVLLESTSPLNTSMIGIILCLTTLYEYSKWLKDHHKKSNPHDKIEDTLIPIPTKSFFKDDHDFKIESVIISNKIRNYFVRPKNVAEVFYIKAQLEVYFNNKIHPHIRN